MSKIDFMIKKLKTRNELDLRKHESYIRETISKYLENDIRDIIVNRSNIKVAANAILRRRDKIKIGKLLCRKSGIGEHVTVYGKSRQLFITRVFD